MPLAVLSFTAAIRIFPLTTPHCICVISPYVIGIPSQGTLFASLAQGSRTLPAQVLLSTILRIKKDLATHGHDTGEQGLTRQIVIVVVTTVEAK